MLQQKYDLLTLGEVMMRLSPSAGERLQYCDTLKKHAGGSEFNVASGAAMLGANTGTITKLPANAFGKFVCDKMRTMNVHTHFVNWDESENARLGVYYYEYGAAPHKPSIVYDRKGSSFTTICANDFNDEMYSSTRCFHTSGITLALNESVQNEAIKMLRKFKENGTLISFDVNYRANLWNEDAARNVIKNVLPLVDILFISEETSRRMMNKSGDLQDIMRSYSEEYGTRFVATTQRKVINPSCHSFTSMVYDNKSRCFYTEVPYDNIQVLDRIGSGDAYVAGVLYGILAHDNAEKAMQIGNAVSALKNTVPGDLPACDLREAMQVISAHNATGYVNELNR